MSKKNLKIPEVIVSRQTVQHNSNKYPQIKAIISPTKRTVNNGSKIATNSKNPSVNNHFKSNEEEGQVIEQQIASNTKSRIKQQAPTIQSSQLKIAKKPTQVVPTAQTAKRFSKTSKVPTLKSTTAKGTSDQSESQMLKSSQTKMFPQQGSSLRSNLNEPDQKSNITQVLQHSNLTISTLKTQLEQIKSQNQQLKKQNEKLNKKVDKLKSVSDENKKLLKQRIQTFNTEGENLRKLKNEILQLEKQIQFLNKKVSFLQNENELLKDSINKLNSPKISRQIQTLIEIDQPNQKLTTPETNLEKDNIKKQCKNYESSSSRKSYGGILPLQTIIKLNSPKFKINFKTAQSTPKKNSNSQYKLMKKYQNYWSQKFDKQPKNTGNQQSQSLTPQAKSQFHQSPVRTPENQKNLNINKLIELELNSIKQKNISEDKIQQAQHQLQKKPHYQNDLDQIIQSNQFTFDYDMIQNNDKNDKKGFSPTILIQNYRKISQQQELIKSLYRVIQELSRQIQTIQKRQNYLQDQNKQLKQKIKKVTLQKQTLYKNNQQPNIILEKANNQTLCQNDETLLLDQTRQDKKKRPHNKIMQNLKNNQIIQQGAMELPQIQQETNQAKSSPLQKPYVIQSAKQRQLYQIMIIEDISRFVHSDVLCHDPVKRFQQSSLIQTNNIQQLNHEFDKQKSRENAKKPNPLFDSVELKQVIASLASQNKALYQKLSSYKLQSNQPVKLVSQAQKSQINPQSYLRKIIQASKNQNQIEMNLKVDDSLEALEYFQMHTPQNITSQVSCLNSLQTQEIGIDYENSNVKSNSNMLNSQNQVIGQSSANLLEAGRIKMGSALKHNDQFYQIMQSQRPLGSDYKSKFEQEMQTTSKDDDQINYFQDSAINTDGMSIV